MLPQIQADPAFALDSLDAYVTNYIREEIQQEALVRNLDAGFGDYTGAEELKDGPLRILPLKRFFVELTEGRLLR